VTRALGVSERRAHASTKSTASFTHATCIALGNATIGQRDHGSRFVCMERVWKRSLATNRVAAWNDEGWIGRALQS
jgi:hypothetical protein